MINGGINQIIVSSTSGVSTLKKNGEINTISMEKPNCLKKRYCNSNKNNYKKVIVFDHN